MMTGDNSSSTGKFYLLFTIAIGFIVFALVFRSILPRLLLRGPLRIRTIGLRGARGIEWKTKSPNRQAESHSQRPDGFNLKIRHIYITFATKKQSIVPHPADIDADRAKVTSRSWITIHVQGVKGLLPYVEQDEEAKQAKIEQAKAHAREEEQRAKREQQEADRRLDALARGSALESYTSTDGLDDDQTDIKPAPSSEPSVDAVQSTSSALHRAWAQTRYSTLKMVRATLFILVSNLPILTSLIDVEIRDIEMYLQEAESVVRADCIGLELAVAIINNDRDAWKSAFCRDKSAGSSRYAAFSETISSVGSSAKGFANLLTVGLPAGRGSLRLSLDGLVVFEAKPPEEDESAAQRLLAIPETSSMEVGLMLGPNLPMGGTEAVEINVAFSPISIGMDAVYRVVRIVEDRKAMRSGPMPTAEGASGDRSGLSAHFAQQRKEPPAKALAALRSLSISVPQITLASDLRPRQCDFAETLEEQEKNRLPSALQAEVIVRKLYFDVSTSQPEEEDHQKWLGTCGTSTEPGIGKIGVIEHRRVFELRAGLSSFEASCRINEQRAASEILHVGEIKSHSRTSWTPFGLFPSSEDGKDAQRRYFQGDPNEQALVGQTTINKIRGDVKLECAMALLAFVEMRNTERRMLRKKLKIDAPAKSGRVSLMGHIPRLALSLEVKDLCYRLDVSQDFKAQAEQHGQHTNLIFKVPKLFLATHGSYRDSYIRRGEAERRAAWKALSNDELEWSLSEDYSSQGPGLSSPRIPTGKFSQFVGRVKEQLTTSPKAQREREARDRRGVETSGSQAEAIGQTMSEAMQGMKEIQRREELSKQEDEKAQEAILPATSGKTGVHRLIKVPTALTRRTPAADRGESGVIYDFDGFFTCPNIESFMVFSEDGKDKQAGAGGAEGSTAKPRRHSKLSKRHFFAINNIESNVLGQFPGAQDVLTDQPTLHLSKHRTRARNMVEEVDIELWHPRVFDVTRQTIADLQASKMPFVTSQQEPDSQEETSGSTPNEEKKNHEEDKPLHLIDYIRAGTDVWFSIGGIAAHLGGSDPNCDPHFCRGVGFEARRIVAELICTDKEAELRNQKSNWGARSALLLPEDIEVSAGALATRHGKAAVGKLSLYEISLFPLLDVERAVQLSHQDPVHAKNKARSQHEERRTSSTSTSSQPAEESGETPAVFADAIWEFQHREPAFVSSARQHFHQEDRSKNYIFSVPLSATKITIRPPDANGNVVGRKAEELTVQSEGTKLLSFKIQLLHTYCILIAVASLKGLLPKRDGKAQPSASANSKQSTSANQGQGARPVQRRSRLIPPTFFVDFGISEIHAFCDLPEKVRLFLHLHRFDVRGSQAEGFSVLWESMMGAVESPKMLSSNIWEEAVRLRDWKVAIAPHGGPEGKLKINVEGDGASLRIPYGYVFHKVIDSTSVAFKATKQLLHQFLKGGTDSIITPVGEDPKHLPFIDANIRILTIEAQDDPIETRLNIIWRAGGDENRARLEREEAFDDKVAELERNAEQEASMASESVTSFKSGASRSSSRRSVSDSDEDDEDSDSIVEVGEMDPNRRNRLEATINAARERLDEYNSSSWIRRYANARAEQGKREDAILKRIFGRAQAYKQAVALPIEMARPTRAAPLFRSSMTKIQLSLGPTSFQEEHLRDWLHEEGKGTPKDLPYSLLVPLHMRLRMGEWRWELRDYPLPLLHIPPGKADQQDGGTAAFELAGDICIAEHLSEGGQSIRHVPTVVIPAATGHPDASEYGINVPKVAMPVKFYGSPTIDINSAYPTRFAWGQSIQPAIQDMVRVFDGITSPPPDPSPKLGFWDKLPLIIHSRFHLRWRGEGELHIYLKGSRDPYSVGGNGAGWVMVWRGNVEVRIGFENEDHEFLQFISNEYILAVPDLRDYRDKAAIGMSNGSDPEEEDREQQEKFLRKGKKRDEAVETTALGSGKQRYKKDAQFSKICIELTNGVRWGASLRHEHTCRDDSCKRQVKCRGEDFYRECRLFERRKHWTVIQRSKEYMATLPEKEQTDSFYGWRSDFSHLGISIFSPKEGLTAYGIHRGTESGRNNLYFSPLAWQHFWAWLRLFDSSMGLPIRQGSLFPTAPPPSPKFGKHLGTIKYRFDIAPLFISHLYTEYSRADWARGVNTMLGIKARLDSFHVDMHQRQQETIKERAELQETKKVFHKPFYEAEADFAGIDLRTLVGRFKDSAKRLVDLEDDQEAGADEQQELFEGDDSLGDDEQDWIDVNDYVEIGYTPDEAEKPEIRLMQALTCPRFSFYRRNDSLKEREAKNKRRDGQTILDENAAGLEKTKFGNEETHTCLIGEGPRAWTVQSDLASDRARCLEAELERLHKRAGWHSDKIADQRKDLQKRIKLIKDYCHMLSNADTLQEGIQMRRDARLREQSSGHLDELRQHAEADVGVSAGPEEDQAKAKPSRTDDDAMMNLSELFQDWDTFDDRFFVHNPAIFFNNHTRHVMLRYYANSKKRKGFVHHMTARAIYNIRKLSRDVDGEGQQRPGTQRQDTQASKIGVELLSGLLNDTKQYVVDGVTDADDKQHNAGAALLDTHVDPTEGIADSYEIKRSNVCVFLKPQIVLKSHIDDSSTVIVTAIRMRLQNYAIMDPTVPDEDMVNHRVLSRNYFSMDGLQAFHPKSDPIAASRGPVFVPVETLIDTGYETQGFDRIVGRTDASVRYDKFNRLRLHDSTRPVVGDVDARDASTDHLRHYMDLLRVRCPRFAVSANSTHFGALYNIVTDLVLYRAPSWREHSKQLETILFSYDFKDTALLADIVSDLQLRIRRGLALDAEYQFHFDQLNEQGRLDLFHLKAELASMVERLLLVAEAITASEDAKSDEDKDKKSALRLEAHAQDLSWNMMGETEGELLAKLSIKGPSFTWLNKADNSAANSLSIVDLSAVDVRPDAHFAEIVTKWNKAPDHPVAKQGRFVNAVWSERAPVGGISIVDQFELEAHPLKVQLELKTGKLIMDYVFGSQRRRQREEEKRQKQMEEESSGPTVKAKKSPFARLTGAMHSDGGKSQGGTPSGNNTPASSAPSSGRPSFSAEQRSIRKMKSSGGSKSSENSLSLAAAGGKEKERKASGHADHDSDSEESIDHSQTAIARRNAEEMRERASSNLTFVFFKLPETVFCLSYKGARDKSITDVYDLVFKAPNIEYRNRTWTYEDLVQHIKKDIFRAAWGQKTTILKSILSHRPKRPEALRNIRDTRLLTRRESRDETASLQVNIEPATPDGASGSTDSHGGASSRFSEIKGDEGPSPSHSEEQDGVGRPRAKTKSGLGYEDQDNLPHSAVEILATLTPTDEMSPSSSSMRVSSDSISNTSNRLGRFLNQRFTGRERSASAGSSGHPLRQSSSGGSGRSNEGKTGGQSPSQEMPIATTMSRRSSPHSSPIEENARRMSSASYNNECPGEKRQHYLSPLGGPSRTRSPSPSSEPRQRNASSPLPSLLRRSGSSRSNLQRGGEEDVNQHPPGEGADEEEKARALLGRARGN